jgi:uridine kinase
VFIYVVGISIILLVIVTTITPGYYLWILPFLLLYVARTTRIGRVLVNLFLLLVLMMFISVSTDVIVSIGSYIIRVDYFLSGGADVASFLMTAVVAGGLILVMRMFVEGVQFNSYFRVSRRPLVLGIAGDTGSGKGKLANSLLNIFGSHSVTMIFGDAYQKWERAAPMWQVISHLNPKATDLSAMTRDVIAVITGETVFRRQYNHIVGRFMSPSPIKPNDIVVVAGLHALFQPQLREKLDVKIFLEVDNDLREFRKLREGLITGVGELNEEKDLVSMRKAESIEHITPQIHHADLIFSLLPVNSRHLFLHSQAGTIPLKLRVRMRDALYYESIIRVLIGICGLQLDWEISDEGRSLDFTVEGDVAADDINLAANSIMPRISDFVGIIPAWENGMIGIMQLITLAHVEQTLRKRILE